MRILYYYSKKGIPKDTGSGTMTEIVLKEMSKRHEVSIYNNRSDLDNGWDLIHILDLKHLDKKILYHKKCPVVVNIHDYYFVNYYKFFCPDFFVRYFLQKYRKRKYKKMFKKIDAVIVHSNFMREIIEHKNKFLVRLTAEKLFNAKNSIQTTDPNIILLGGDYFRKGLKTVIDSLPLILKEIPNVQIKIIGPEPKHSLLFAKFLSRKLPIQYFPTGLHRDKLIMEMKNSRLLILPSEIEAFGIVILEAMKMGIPVIGSNVGGIPDIIKNGKNGLLISPGDHKTLAEYVIKLLSDNNISKKFVSEANNTLEHFSLFGMIEDLEKVYQSVSK